MPCLAKKHECALENMNDAGAGQDVDVVLTTREVDRLIRAEHIIPQDLKEEEFDTPLGAGTARPSFSARRAASWKRRSAPPIIW